MLFSEFSSFIFSTWTHILSSCICNVSIYAQLPSGSCLSFARHRPYWPPGAPPALCQLLGRCRLAGCAVSCSLHRWHPSLATARSGSGSAHLTGVRASEHPIWPPARTETGLLEYTWAVLDAVSQLGRKQINTNHNWFHVFVEQCPLVYYMLYRTNEELKKHTIKDWQRQEQSNRRILILTKITPTKSLQCVFCRGGLFQLTIPAACQRHWNSQTSQWIGF